MGVIAPRWLTITLGTCFSSIPPGFPRTPLGIGIGGSGGWFLINPPGMNRFSFPRSLSHPFSMIIFVVHVVAMAFFEFKTNAPISGNLYGPPVFIFGQKEMKA